MLVLDSAIEQQIRLSPLISRLRERTYGERITELGVEC
jgi:hypothetical protein